LVSYNNSGFVPIDRTRKILKDEFDQIPVILRTALANRQSENITITELSKFFNKQETITIYNKLQIWTKEGKYSIIFDNEKEMDFNSSNKIGFDLTSVVKNKVILIPMLYYILYMIEQNSKGEPTIIAIDNAWDLFDNSVMGPELVSMLNRMTKKNMHMLFSINMSEKSTRNYITDSISSSLGTIILLPNKKVDSYYAGVFDISDDEINMLGIMTKNDRNFIIKNGEDVVISSLDLKGFEKEFFVLSGGEIAYDAMNKAITTVKSVDSKDWIELFYENAVQMKKEQQENRLKEKEKKQKEWEAKKSTENTNKKIINKQ
jgi:type IV secretion system protein VirB4